MGLDYSTDFMGDHVGGERIVGLGMARRTGYRIAESMTASARSSGDEPAVRVTSERGVFSFWDAHRIWTARNGVHSTDYFARSHVWQVMIDTLYERLAANEVHLERFLDPQGWYVVDLRRWEHRPVDDMDIQPDWEIGDDWLPVQEAWYVPESS